MYNPYTKAIIGAAIALIASFITAVEDGSGLTTSEITWGIIAGIAGLSLVWANNLMVKWLVGALIAGLGAFAEAIQDSGISTQEYLFIFGAALTALATVWAVPNTVASNAPALDANVDTKTPVVDVVQ
jgi:hypothetical protein